MSRRLLGLAAFGVLASAAHGEGTVRLSVDRARKDSNGPSSAPAMTPDARFVAFASDATDLVRNDTNGVTDVFVLDRVRGSIERVSVDSSEHEVSAPSFDPSISADGRFVAFTSLSDNLVQGDTNKWQDVFVRDRLRGKTVRVSVTSAGLQGSEGSFSARISADGSTVAFVSQAPDLVPDDGNFSWDVFVHELASGLTERVSVDSSGAEADSGSLDPAISADGGTVAFASLASNLGGSDQNALLDVYVRDRAAHATTRASIGLGGQDADDASLHPALSGDGLAVAFESHATNLVSGDGNACSDVFVLDRVTSVIERVSVDSSAAECGGASHSPSLSPDGRWVVFASSGQNLVANDSNGVDDVFAHDRHTGITSRCSVPAAGGESNGASGEPCVSGNGDNVVFSSVATNLVPKDRNRASDIFARERCTKEASTSVYGAAWPGTLGDPQLIAGNDPELNLTFHLTITNSWGQPSPSLIVIGPRKASLVTNRDGTLLVDPLFYVPTCVPPEGLTIDCPLPGDESACGVEIDVQVLEFDPGATRCASFTKGLELIFGY